MLRCRTATTVARDINFQNTNNCANAHRNVLWLRLFLFRVINFKNKNNMSKKINRHFLVFYTGVCEDNSIVNGYCDFTTNGYYLNAKQTVSELMKVQKRKVVSLVLTNIVELSISDFKDWKSSFSSTEP